MVKRNSIKIIGLTVAAFLLWTTYLDISSGQIKLKYGDVITTDANPRQFWLTVLFKTALCGAILVWAFSRAEEK